MSTSWSIGLAVAASCAIAAPIEGAQPIESYLASVGQIESYDVTVTARTAFHLKATAVNAGGGRRGVRYRFLLPEEEQAERISTTRQVWEESGRRRTELNVSSTGWSSAKVFNGEIVRTIESKTLQGSLRKWTPHQQPFLASDERYDVLFSELFYGGTYAALFQEREGISIDETSRGAKIISPPQASGMYPEFGFSLLLDASHGYLPSQITLRQGEVLKGEWRILRFHSPSAGVWVPVEAEQKLYERLEIAGVQKDVPLSTTTISVDVNRSRWNEQIDENEFVLPFPDGARVHDEIRGTVFIAGKDDTGTNMESLLSNAKEYIRQGNRDRTHASYALGAQQPSWIRRSLILLNVVIIAAIALFFVWRKINFRSTT